ncbi:IspD/TarI family cytidylyltransferase [uncultured Bifidobacterium sp.]|uniref:IspD/TarI family cytidylyltransferase n=1 Tax=uncultured Bifidobacterium sp. TaxID=165187 RepID=UPI00345AA8E4
MSDERENRDGDVGVGSPSSGGGRHDGGSVPVVAVVLAAGLGTRFDPLRPKQLVSVGGRPVVVWSVEAFESDERVTDILVVVNPQVRHAVERLADERGWGKVRAVIDGGEQRSDSTARALTMLAGAGIPGNAKILIHDAVRPFVGQRCIDSCIEALDGCDAATVAVASTDTILVASESKGMRVVASVPDRSVMYRAQTPQAFRFETLSEAYRRAFRNPGFTPTDDTRVVVDYLPDTSVLIVPGDETNIKITTRDDMPVAERIAASLLPCPDAQRASEAQGR